MIKNKNFNYFTCKSKSSGLCFKNGSTRTVVLIAPVFFFVVLPRGLYTENYDKTQFSFFMLHIKTQMRCALGRVWILFTYLITKSVKCAINLYRINMVDYFIVIRVD